MHPDRRLCRTCRPIDSRESASLWAFWRGRRYVALFCTKNTLGKMGRFVDRRCARSCRYATPGSTRRMKNGPPCNGCSERGGQPALALETDREAPPTGDRLDSGRCPTNGISWPMRDALGPSQQPQVERPSLATINETLKSTPPPGHIVIDVVTLPGAWTHLMDQ